MKENYDHCLGLILHHEGGYVNHPKDPGGETNKGITKSVITFCTQFKFFKSFFNNERFLIVSSEFILPKGE